MPFTKQGEFVKKPSDLPDVPSPSLTPTEIKSYFDNPSNELKTNVNKLMDDLAAQTAAGELGALDGTTPTTIQERLTKFKTDIASKTDKTGNHEGTWQGYTPSQVDETVGSRLDQHDAQLAEIAINAKKYGMKLDGLTDDATALQEALDYVSNQGGGRVIVPFSPNGFLLGKTISVKDNTTLDCMSNTVKADTSIYTYDASGGLIVVGRPSSDNTLATVKNAHLVRVIVNGINAPVRPLLISKGENCSITWCRSLNAVDWGIGGRKGKYNTYAYNYVENPGNHGFATGGKENVADLEDHYKFINNTVVNAPGYAFDVRSITGGLVQGNTSIDCNQFFKNQNGPTTIIDNVIKGSPNQDDTVGQTTFYITHPQTIVKNNKIQDSKYLFLIDGAVNCIIAGNILKTSIPLRYGFRIYGNITNCIFENNIMEADSVRHSMFYVEPTVILDNCKIKSNIFKLGAGDEGVARRWGMYLQGLLNSDVKDNTIIMTAKTTAGDQYGLYAKDNTNSSINHNFIEQGATDGISFDVVSGNQKCKVIGNVTTGRMRISNTITENILYTQNRPDSWWSTDANDVPLTSAGNPNGVKTPRMLGDKCYDTSVTPKGVYEAVGTTINDWLKLN